MRTLGKLAFSLLLAGALALGTLALSPQPATAMNGDLCPVIQCGAPPSDPGYTSFGSYCMKLDFSTQSILRCQLREFQVTPTHSNLCYTGCR